MPDQAPPLKDTRLTTGVEALLDLMFTPSRRFPSPSEMFPNLATLTTDTEPAKFVDPISYADWFRINWRESFRGGGCE